MAHSCPCSSSCSTMPASGILEIGEDTVLVSSRYRNVTGRPCAQRSCPGTARRSHHRVQRRRASTASGTPGRPCGTGVGRLATVQGLGERQEQRQAYLGESVGSRLRLRLRRRSWGGCFGPLRWNTDGTCSRLYIYVYMDAICIRPPDKAIPRTDAVWCSPVSPPHPDCHVHARPEPVEDRHEAIGPLSRRYRSARQMLTSDA